MGKKGLPSFKEKIILILVKTVGKTLFRAIAIGERDQAQNQIQ